MKITIEPFTIHKRFPLTISRGTTATNTNLWLKIEAEGIEGWGEASVFSITHEKPSTANLQEEFVTLIPLLEPWQPWQRQSIEKVLQETGVSTAVQGAIDTALYDWLGKRAGLPLWQLWGLNLQQIVPTSVTIGITTPEAAQQRVKQWQDLIGAKVFKLKMGNPAGIEADQALFLAVQKTAPNAEITVDANGGWNLNQALKMVHWLAEKGVKHLEQPLPVEAIADYRILYQQSPLPLFADESCWHSEDIPGLINLVHGINIKLMKAGGLTQVLRLIYTGRALGFKIMFGCYSDSILANTAMAHLAPLADYVDLDSHFNLIDDPFQGATLQEGCLIPGNSPGLAVEYVKRV